MWLNLVALWFALNAAVVSVLLLRHRFGRDRERPVAHTIRTVRQPEPEPADAAPPAPSPERHRTRHRHHRPLRDVRPGEPPFGPRRSGSPR